MLMHPALGVDSVSMWQLQAEPTPLALDWMQYFSSRPDPGIFHG